MRRLSKWVRRHILTALTGVELLVLVVYVALIPISRLDVVGQIVRSQNISAARTQAGAVTNELRMRAERVSRLALDADLRSLLANCPRALPAHVVATFGREFDSIWTFRLDGTPCGAWPAQPARETTYAWRDYFIGQQKLATSKNHGVYVARIIRDDVDSELKLGYATPLFDADGLPVGAVVATTRTRGTFGSVQMKFSAAGDCMTALLGPRDRDAAAAPPSAELTVIAQPGLRAGAQVTLSKSQSQLICQRLGCEPRVDDPFEFEGSIPIMVDDNLLEPMHGQRTIAAIAPVAHTGLSVMVATPHASISALNHAIRDRFMDRLIASLWLPMGLGGLAVALLALITLRRPRAHRAP